jgi:hypothetical protein
MSADELIEAVTADYLAAELPADPAGRLAALRDIVAERWATLSPDDRLTVGTDLDGSRAVTAGDDDASAALEELSDHDDEAVDSITSVVRARIPELSVPET